MKERLAPGFELLCFVEADLKPVYQAARSVVSPLNGTRYRRVEYDICLSLGQTELKARIRWRVKGKWKYGPAAVVYE